MQDNNSQINNGVCVCVCVCVCVFVVCVCVFVWCVCVCVNQGKEEKSWDGPRIGEQSGRRGKKGVGMRVGRREEG